MTDYADVIAKIGIGLVALFGAWTAHRAKGNAEALENKKLDVITGRGDHAGIRAEFALREANMRSDYERRESVMRSETLEREKGFKEEIVELRKKWIEAERRESSQKEINAGMQVAWDTCMTECRRLKKIVETDRRIQPTHKVRGGKRKGDPE